MPNRILKESICTSDTLETLTWFEEVFFYRLIVNCDDYGRFDARPTILKSRLFPLKNVTDMQIENALYKLSTVGIVSVYKYDGRPYLQFVTWDKHQQVRAKKSKFPAFDCNGNHLISNDSNCYRNPIQSESESNPIHSGGGVNAHTREEKNDNEMRLVVEAYENNIGFINLTISETLYDFYKEGLSADVIIQAIKEAALQNKRNCKYISGILMNCKNEGITTLAGWEERKRSRQEGQPKHTLPQREKTFADMAKELEEKHEKG